MRPDCSQHRRHGYHLPTAAHAFIALREGVGPPHSTHARQPPKWPSIWLKARSTRALMRRWDAIRPAARRLLAQRHPHPTPS